LFVQHELLPAELFLLMDSAILIPIKALVVVMSIVSDHASRNEMGYHILTKMEEKV